MKSKILTLTFLLCLTLTSAYSTTATLSFEIEKTNYVYVEGKVINDTIIDISDKLSEELITSYDEIDYSSKSESYFFINKIIKFFNKWYK
jgi:hypothetical protein